MNDELKFSDEYLNAFIDNELDCAEWAELIQKLRRDEALAIRVCELRQIKEMVRKVCAEPVGWHPTPVRRKYSNRWRPIGAYAAGVALIVGGFAGWFGYVQGLNHAGGGFEQVAWLDPAKRDPNKILVHVATADAGRLRTALDRAEELLRANEASARKVQIEIVANAAGVELLQSDDSPQVERILGLIARYDNLAFIACSRSLEKLRLRGIDVHLIPAVGVVPGALEEIVTRLQDGWTYIKV